MEISDENFTFKYSTTEDSALVDDEHVGTLEETASQLPGNYHLIILRIEDKLI